MSFDDILGDFNREIRELTRDIDDPETRDDVSGLWDSGEEQSFWTAIPALEKTGKRKDIPWQSQE